MSVTKLCSRGPRFFDIGANLTDAQFKGVYHGKQKHENDFEAMMRRAHEQGVRGMLVTGSSLEESANAMYLASKHKGLFSTVGVHPCHSSELSQDLNARSKYYADLERLAVEGKRKGIVKAFGEIGLDYDRLHYAPADVQRKAFAEQLVIATRLDLPLFLHTRACAADFYSILAPYVSRLPRGGVVHSFTGSVDEAKRLIDLGFYIGVNGCSLKSEDNLNVIRNLPLDRLLLETDGPWCEIRPSHASSKYIKKLPYSTTKPEKFHEGSMVRGRCEPAAIVNVAEVVAALHERTVEDVANIAWENSVNLFALENLD